MSEATREDDTARAQKLLRMAGQISAFYRAYPEAEAVKGIVAHINAYWTPGMRADLLAAPLEGDALLRAARRAILETGAPSAVAGHGQTPQRQA